MDSAKKFKILIADDDNISVILLINYLKSINADFIIARNGQEALDLFNQNPNLDLILMDIKMPMLDGLEVTRQIKAKNPNIKIIAETAFAMADDERKAIEAGCDAYITKPFNAERLITLVNDLLGD